MTENTTQSAGCLSHLTAELGMTSDEHFKHEYLCTFEPDPQVEECVKFLRRSSPDEIRIAKRDNLFLFNVFKEATRILNSV